MNIKGNCSSFDVSCNFVGDSDSERLDYAKNTFQVWILRK